MAIALSLAARAWLLWARPLWFDELFTIWAARLSLSRLLAILANDSGPPLWYVIEKPFVLVAERFFSADALARVPAFLATAGLFAGVSALPPGAARRRFLFLAAASPLLLLYSAEARAYGLLATECLALYLLTLRGAESLRRLAAVALVCAAALYTHYLALFAVGSLTLVALAEKRTRSALAMIVGAIPFLFWVPVMAGQPREAIAWMHEPPSKFVAGVLSALGGGGEVPSPFGPPLPRPLPLAGVAIALVTAFLLARLWRSDADARRASAFLVLFFGGVLLASVARPVAFAGRTEMAILPVWLWTVALAGERSRAVRIASTATMGVALLSSAFLLASHRERPAPALVLESIERIARPGDVLVAGAHFYLPALLDTDRGRLRIPVLPFPVDQAAHPGWSVPVRLRPEDVAAVEAVLARSAPGSRVYFELPPSYAGALHRLLVSRGVVKEIVRTPEVVLLSWSRRSAAAVIPSARSPAARDPMRADAPPRASASA